MNRDKRGIDARYVPPIPEGYIHWTNVFEISGRTLTDYVEKIQREDDIPLEDILIDTFVPDDGYNKPMKAIFVRDVHVDKARMRDMMLRALLHSLGLEI